jgi:hypothetical protein
VGQGAGVQRMAPGVSKDLVRRNISSTPGVVMDCGVPGAWFESARRGDRHVKAGGRRMAQTEGL